MSLEELLKASNELSKKNPLGLAGKGVPIYLNSIVSGFKPLSDKQKLKGFEILITFLGKITVGLLRSEIKLKSQAILL